MVSINGVQVRVNSTADATGNDVMTAQLGSSIVFGSSGADTLTAGKGQVGFVARTGSSSSLGEQHIFVGDNGLALFAFSAARCFALSDVMSSATAGSGHNDTLSSFGSDVILGIGADDKDLLSLSATSVLACGDHCHATLYALFSRIVL